MTKIEENNLLHWAKTTKIKTDKVKYIFTKLYKK